jgi:hypothetical protein
MQWTDHKAPPVAALLASVQPAGLVALLVLSVIAEGRQKMSPH